MIVSTKSETIVLFEVQYEPNGDIYAPLALIRANAYPRGKYERTQQLWLCEPEMSKVLLGTYRLRNANSDVLNHHQMVNHVQFEKVEMA